MQLYRCVEKNLRSPKMPPAPKVPKHNTNLYESRDKLTNKIQVVYDLKERVLHTWLDVSLVREWL